MSLKKLWQNFQVRAETPGSCWALDLGATAVRAVSLRRSGKVAEARMVSITRAAPGSPNREETIAALRELMSPRPIRGEVAVSMLPLHRVFLRSLEVPFSRLNLIEQVISSEAELHIPFPLDQVVIDFWPQESAGEGKTRVMMAAVRKDFLSAHLEMLAEAGLSPAVVGLGLTGLALACRKAGQLSAAGVSMLVEIGAVHTAVAFFLAGRLVSLRGFTWGGDSVSGAIMKDSGCSFPEAEKLKMSPGPAELAPGVRSALATLESELRRTLHGAAGVLENNPVEVLLLAGGGSAFAPVRAVVEEVAGTGGAEADPWRGLKGTRKIPGGEEALGRAVLALTPLPRRVNFRREEFSFAGSWTAVRRRLFVSLGLVVGLLVLLTVTLEVLMRRQERILDNLGTRIGEILASSFPGEVKAGAELAAMEGGLKKMKEDFDYYRGFSSLSGLDIIRELSRIIPQGVKVQVVELSVNKDRLRLRGRTDSYNSADQIKKAIQDSPLFRGQEIKESPARTRLEAGKMVTVEFVYTIPVPVPE